MKVLKRSLGHNFIPKRELGNELIKAILSS